MSDSPSMRRPSNSIGGGLQHERTALAWERTAIAMMVAGVVFARHASEAAHLTLSGVGVGQILGGAMLLVWAARHDRLLHDPAVHPSLVPQVGLTRLVGIGTTVFTGAALGLAVGTVVAQVF